MCNTWAHLYISLHKPSRQEFCRVVFRFTSCFFKLDQNVIHPPVCSQLWLKYAHLCAAYVQGLSGQLKDKRDLELMYKLSRKMKNSLGKPEIRCHWVFFSGVCLNCWWWYRHDGQVGNWHSHSSCRKPKVQGRPKEGVLWWPETPTPIALGSSLLKKTFVCNIYICLSGQYSGCQQFIGETCCPYRLGG